MDKTKLEQLKKELDELDLSKVTGGVSDQVKELEKQLQELLEQAKVADDEGLKQIEEYIEKITKQLQELYGGNGGGKITQ